MIFSCSLCRFLCFLYLCLPIFSMLSLSLYPIYRQSLSFAPPVFSFCSSPLPSLHCQGADGLQPEERADKNGLPEQPSIHHLTIPVHKKQVQNEFYSRSGFPFPKWLAAPAFPFPSYIAILTVSGWKSADFPSAPPLLSSAKNHLAIAIDLREYYFFILLAKQQTPHRHRSIISLEITRRTLEWIKRLILAARCTSW